MRVSYQYLKKHVDISDVSAEEIAKRLTFAGAEVEGIYPLASGTRLVIGKILSCAMHPDSDHLHVLQVDEGAKLGVHQIVCGAPNAREGLKVIVACSGALLPGGEIKPSKIRGVESDGMCCSLAELGVDKKYLSEKQVSGIEELPEDAPVGCENVLEYLHLNDVAIDLDLLPNRPDLYAYENVAREVGCLFDRPVRFDPLPEMEVLPSDFHCSSETKKCSIFTAYVYSSVERLPSSDTLKEILLTGGIRSISNIVDIGNYIMLLTGQPLNMYDADKLPSKELIVRDDFEGPFVAMDGNTYSLKKGDLVVTSAGIPVCLAGIMTSAACCVDESTKNVVVEAALFDFASIRRTSNRLGASSDSSLRFCKGINPEQLEDVQKKTEVAFAQFAPFQQCQKAVAYDVYPHTEKVLKLDYSYVNSRLGTSFEPSLIRSTLQRDFFSIVSYDETSCLVKVPPYRIDVDGNADLTEELIRILGYECVQSTLPFTKLSLTGLTADQKKDRSIRHYLLSQGLDEVLTYTLVSDTEQKKFPYLNYSEPYRLKNPMTVDHSFVRTNLTHSVLKVASFNVAHQNDNLGLFEISDIDAKKYQGKMLSVVFSGDFQSQGSMGSRPFDFYDAKGILEGLMELLGIGKNRYALKVWSLGGEELHPGKSAEVIVGKQIVGFLGELHPLCLKEYGLKNAVVLSLDLKALYSIKCGSPKSVIPSKYPLVFRDLAVVVDEKIAYGDLRKEALKASPLIRAVDVFDVYRGTGVSEGKKSIAMTLAFGLDDRTLKDAETNEAFEKACVALKDKFKAEVRE